MLRLFLLAIPGLLLFAGVLYLKNSAVGSAEDSLVSEGYGESKNELIKASLPAVAIAPDLVATRNNAAGNNFKNISFELSNGIKDVLDSLIFSSGSTDKSDILSFAEKYCQQQNLSQTGCVTFLGLLARYIDYKLELKLVEQQKLNISDHIAAIEFQFETIRSAQERYFNPTEAEALFGEDWIMDKQALVRKSIALNKTLSREERAQLIAQQIEDLPENEKAALQPTLTMNRIAELKSSHNDKHLTLLDVETEIGFKAAQRLAKTWQKQEDFQRRIDLISQQYLALTASISNEEERASQRERLLAEHFQGNELRRVKAILKHQNVGS